MEFSNGADEVEELGSHLMELKNEPRGQRRVNKVIEFY